ncbi:thermonuclease family protein [Nostoc sp. FACHB-190]|uniref:thermonuclease family protein n=1 Tax=Nostoc sp. FACHB-190 TaxID=2692838 RepID=UPI001F557015|nr:thermonuclease family protein [Nostoc sp. FACHB-190]
MNAPILLFLDINGVIDVEDTDVQGENLPQEYSTVHPVPGAKEFLQVIDSCSWIHPVWISTWGKQSQAWNKWAKTRCWPWAYPLDSDERHQALELIGHGSDKYLAARWYSRDWQHRIVWIEDGFWLSSSYDGSMGAAVKWAENNSNVKLIDTAPTVKQHRQGCKKGIRHWNIEQICDVLDIQQSREILLNQIKAPVTEELAEVSELTNVAEPVVANSIDNSKAYLQEPPVQKQVNTSGRTGTIIGAIAAIAAIIEIVIISVLIFQRELSKSVALTEKWTVAEVIGGDTMLVHQTNGNRMLVRLCGINARESSVASAHKLRSLVAAAQNQVMIIPVKKDIDEYMIAEVMAKNSGEAEISFQEELLKGGLAKISNSGLECPNRIAFENAQRIGKSSQVGVWKQVK